jgi:hypothetical protein
MRSYSPRERAGSALDCQLLSLSAPETPKYRYWRIYAVAG